ncbi:DUF4253 domain-containing protein [Streptomyces sp. NPDC051183]|uniref:DUF4253 domain-containing protein n=1 Tax=Streptomyces sp. NPDC051183 TaxID=3155165 RepID=UPI00342C2B7E
MRAARSPLDVLAADSRGRGRGPDLGLPPGALITRPGRRLRRAVPLLWVSDAAVGGDCLAGHRGGAPAALGLYPVLLQDRRGLEEWWRLRELYPERMSDPGDHDARQVLREHWSGAVPDPEEGAEGAELIAPFGRDWPGQAAPLIAGQDPEAAAGALARDLVRDGGCLPSPRLALVPAGRGADVLAAIGWGGPANHENDTARIAAVLRSWEDRFGARVVALGFDELHVSVAAPPRTRAEALAVAAEHFAFCPDNVWQGSGSIRAYADEALTGSAHWSFWWD